MTHRYTTTGSKDIMLTAYNSGCDSTAEHAVNIIGPLASFTQSSSEACVDGTITFELGDTAGLTSFKWFPEGELSLVEVPNVDPYIHTYTDYDSEIIPVLEVTGSGATCRISGDTIVVYRMEAVIGYLSSSEYCHNRNVYFKGSDSRSFANDSISYSWDFGDGTGSTDANPSKAYDAGQYLSSLTINNNFGCENNVVDTVVINKLPVIETYGDTAICPGESAQLTASGGSTITWFPNLFLDDNRSYSPIATPDSTITYSPIVRDTITDCSSISGAANITVQVAQIPDYQVVVEPADTSIVIGGIVTIRTDSSGDYRYTWSPDQYISCVNCATPTIQPLDPGQNEYILTLSDFLDCNAEDYSVNIEVREEYIIGVPDAFTPDGNTVNDVLYVDGLGVKDLLEFRVYNRWGNEVFFSDDMAIGWDGTNGGKDQPIDTYTYYIKAEMFDGGIAEKRGSVSLIR